MIILEADVAGVAVVVEAEDDAPVPGDGDRPGAGPAAAQGVQSARAAHVAGAAGDIQGIEDRGDFRQVAWRQAPRVAAPPVAPQPGVPEGADSHARCHHGGGSPDCAQ